MPTSYRYELWNGKKVVGYYDCYSQILGHHVVVWEESTLKQSYYKKARSILVPLTCRVIVSNHSDTLVRTVLDVRRKSKRQIALLQGGIETCIG